MEILEWNGPISCQQAGNNLPKCFCLNESLTTYNACKSFHLNCVIFNTSLK
jgi:hypothetical protein